MNSASLNVYLQLCWRQTLRP